MSNVDIVPTKIITFDMYFCCVTALGGGIAGDRNENEILNSVISSFCWSKVVIQLRDQGSLI